MFFRGKLCVFRGFWGLEAIFLQVGFGAAILVAWENNYTLLTVMLIFILLIMLLCGL